MLLRLSIENLALIERAELEPAAGLNALTGETGAGKTMLAQAIGLVTGAQPAVDLVGPHAEETYVEAEFAVPDAFFEDEELAAVAGLRPEGEQTLVVARRLLRSGRSRALVWGRTCARADLEVLGDRLLEVSSQHEARRLARPAYQLALLDGFAGLEAELARMALAWAALCEARRAVEAASAEAADARCSRGELEELAARVDELALEPGEPETLAADRDRLRHLDELREAAAGAAELLSPEQGEGALSQTGRAAELLASVERIEPRLGEAAAELRDAAVRIQEAGHDLAAYLDGLEADPGRLEWVEGRLAAIAELERRFGAPVGELVPRAEAARAALEELDAGGGRLAALEAAAEAALADAVEAAERLSAARQEAAPRFASAVESELAELGMKGARLEPGLRAGELSARGRDQLELLLAANSGLAAAPLAQTASGGELSRIALAVRVAARSGGGPGTLLLDEVDAGVGGKTARAVGEKLRQLSGDAQLLVITHLPQIASLADAHFSVAKHDGDPTITRISRLGDDQVVEELARMLGGDDGQETARAHAEALLSAE